MKKLLFSLFLFASFNLSASSILGYWNFDEGLLDQSPHSILTTGTDLGIVSGKFGRAIYFNGSTSLLRAADNQSLKLGPGNFSLSAWIRPTQAGSFDYVINKRGTGVEGSQPGVIFGISDAGSGFSLSAIVDDGQNAFVNCSSCGSTYPYNNWYFVALVYEGNELRLYVNGQPDSNVLGSTVDTVNNNQALFVGGNTVHDGIEGALSNQFSGAIDEVKVYDDVLQASDVLAIYNSDNEDVFSTRLGKTKTESAPGVAYERNVVYRADTDGFVLVYLSGGRCDRNNLIVYTGHTAETVDLFSGRVGHYNSVTVPVAKGEFWLADHYSRYSSCKPTVMYRPMY